MPANLRRLVEVGMPPPMAKETAAVITAGAVSATAVRRLTEVGMIPRHIRELRSQISGVRNVKGFTEAGFVPRVARELVAQMDTSNSPGFLSVKSMSSGVGDMLAFGNSKALFNGKEGWHYALSIGIGARTGVWASSYYPILATQGGISNQGGGESATNNTSGSATLPGGYDNFVVMNSSATYFATGGTSANNKLVNLRTDTLMNVNSALRYTIAVGGFASGSGGSVRPSVRLGADGPQTFQLQAPTATPTDFGAGQQQFIQTLTLPAAQRNRSLQFGPYVSGGTQDVGPNLFFGHYVEDMVITRGTSHSVLLALGGNSMRDIALAFAAVPDARAINQLGVYVNRQLARGVTPKLTIIIQEGMNSRSDTAPSVGPSAGLASNTGAGYVDNTAAIYLRVKALITAAGWQQSWFRYIFIVDEWASANEPQLQAFGDAIKAYAASLQDASALVMNDLITWNEMVALGMVPFADSVHKTPAFYAEAYQNRATKYIFGEGFPRNF